MVQIKVICDKSSTEVLNIPRGTTGSTKESRNVAEWLFNLKDDVKCVICRQNFEKCLEKIALSLKSKYNKHSHLSLYFTYQRHHAAMVL